MGTNLIGIYLYRDDKSSQEEQPTTLEIIRNWAKQEKLQLKPPSKRSNGKISIFRETSWPWINFCFEELGWYLEGEREDKPIKKLSLALSKALNSYALFYLVIDSDVLNMELSYQGKVLDTFCSDPGYLGIDSPQEQNLLAGKIEKWLPLVIEGQQETLQKALLQAEEHGFKDFNFAEEQLVAIGEALNFKVLIPEISEPDEIILYYAKPERWEQKLLNVPHGSEQNLEQKKITVSEPTQKLTLNQTWVSENFSVVYHGPAATPFIVKISGEALQLGLIQLTQVTLSGVNFYESFVDLPLKVPEIELPATHLTLLPEHEYVTLLSNPLMVVIASSLTITLYGQTTHIGQGTVQIEVTTLTQSPQTLLLETPLLVIQEN